MTNTKITVRGYHCDAYGHVNNAVYLQFLEEARWDFLQPCLDSKFFESRSLIFVVVNIDISFKKPVFPHDVIEVSVVSASYNNSSIVVYQEIKRGEMLCTQAKVTFVLLNTLTNKPSEVSAEIISTFNSLF